MSESRGGTGRRLHQRSPECLEQQGQKCHPNLWLRHGDLGCLSGPLAPACFTRLVRQLFCTPSWFRSHSFSAQVSHRWCCCPQQRTRLRSRAEAVIQKNSQPLSAFPTHTPHPHPHSPTLKHSLCHHSALKHSLCHHSFFPRSLGLCGLLN